MFTYLETTGVAFRLSIVVAHFKNRATSPLAGIGSEDNAYTRQLFKVVKHKRFVAAVCQSVAHVVVVLCGRLHLYQVEGGQLLASVEIVEVATETHPAAHIVGLEITDNHLLAIIIAQDNLAIAYHPVEIHLRIAARLVVIVNLIAIATLAP